MAYNPYRFSDPASQNATGRGGAGTSRGGITYLGGVPRPQGQATPTTQLRSLGRDRGRDLGLSPVIGMSGNFGMGRDDGRRISARPTFLSSDAYYRARGSGLDYLAENGPNRASAPPVDMGGATYGGLPAGSGPSASDWAGGGPNTSGSSIGGSISPYQEMTGAAPQAANDYTPEGRRTRMGQEQQALIAQGLSEGRAAVNQVKASQATPQAPTDLSMSPTPSGAGMAGSGRFGSASVYPYGGGPSRSFGRYGSPTPEAARQAELGESAIAAVQRRVPGTTQSSLVDSYYRRFGRR